MKNTRYHKLRVPTSLRIAEALERIDDKLQHVVFYKKANEDRQQIFTDVFVGMIAGFQHWFANLLGPKHPVGFPVPRHLRVVRQHSKPGNRKSVIENPK